MMTARSMSFAPVALARREANIVVDGAANEETVLVLSHWPKSGTPALLKADTSAEIVFRYLDRPQFHKDCRLVTNDHFDEDGLAGIFSLVYPARALAQRALLIDLAHAGDFGTYRDRRAARLSFAISRFIDPELSPWGKSSFPENYPERCQLFYERFLPLLGDWLEDVDHCREHWREEDDFLEASESALALGQVKIREIRELDLAVVEIPADWPEKTAHRFTQMRRVFIHPMAIHNRTRCSRILSFCGQGVQYNDRYEGWVQVTSHRPLPRRDLRGLAEALSELEADKQPWRATGPDHITPSLRPERGRSGLGQAEIIARIREHLASAPPAFDPYD
jgi:hypothetical protein